MERIFTPFYRGIWMCILLVTAHASIEAQNFPFTLPELPAGKSIRIYYRVNTNGTFSPVNATSISEQALIGFTGGTQNSDDPNTPAANDPTLTPAFAFDCTDFGSTVYVDSSATPGGDGTSWATAFNDLQAGLVVAQMCPRVDSVLVAKGTYYPSVSDRNAFFNIPDSSVVLGGFPSGGSPLADRMPECNPTILSGDINMSGDSTGNSYHVVKTINYLGTIYVDGFIIEAGNTVADMDDGAGWWDGSIHSTGILDINHVIFRNNIGVRGAAFYGEGLRKLNLVNSIFEYNTATDRGGAVYFTPASVLGPPVPVVLFENNLFHHNTATINGGAIALTFTPGIDFSIINNTIADNSPDAFNNNSGGNVVVGNTIFWNNGMSDITGAVIPTVTYSLVNNVPHPTNTSGDPLFGVNYRPGLGSFLTIDRGSNAFSSQATDLIGFPRINISIIDMGVYEVQTFLCLDSTIYVGNDVFKWPVDSIYVGGFAPGTVQLVNGVPGIDTLYFDCSMLGDSVILISIVDTSCGKNSPEFGCMFTATVRDGSAPMAMCKDLTVNLYSTMTTIASRDLDNGSTDNCGVVSWVASDTVFDCMDVGTQMISLTVSDAGGNTSICTSMVTVVDDKAPVPSCANGPTFNLMPGMPDPSVTITVDDILTSPVTDNCGVDTVYLSQSVFTCTDLGQKLITLTAVDVNGNSDFCLTYVTIADPMILCCDTPSITCPADILVTADPFACEVKISYPDPTVMSNCTPVITQLSGPASDSILDFGMYTVQFEASNGPTKNDTCSFTITVLENGQSQPLQSTAKRAAAGLACHDHVNISLSSDCMREITARDVLVTGSAGCIDRYNCEVFKPGSLIPIPGATLTYEHVGQTLTYVVEDVQDGGKCWGTLKLEDKLGPVIRCENDTLTCLEAAIRSTDDYFESLVSDCGPYPVQVDIVNSIWEDFQCEDSLFSGKITRTIRSSDPWGNHNECVQEIWIERIRIDSLICPDTIEFECTTLELLKVIYGDNLDSIIHVPGVTLDFEALDPLTLQIAGLLLGYHDVLTFPEVKTMDGGTSPLWLSDYYYQLFPGLANAHCNAFAEYEDQVFEVCGNARKIRRTWTIYDWCDHRDTTCEQWIIVRDTTPPLFNIFPYLTGIIGDDMEMDTTTLLGLLDPFNVLAYTEPHDCKAHVHLPDLKKYFFDCSPFEMGYEVEVADPHHPGKTTVLSGTLPDDIYLPEGVFTVKFRLVDACWNTSYEAFPEDAFGGIGIFSNFFNTLIPGITVQVLDATPPTPVCDEITQVTLDPASCWARINAEDLDDGSHDNCCDQLYYAVALKDSVDYYEAKFQDFLSSVTEEYLGVDLTLDGLGLYEGKAPNLVSFMRVAHEVWMNLCAFDVVEDLTECGEDQVVLRVYEACGLRPYDEHIKKNVTCILPPIYQTTPGGTPTAVYQWTIDTKQEHFFYELMNACWDDYFPLLGCITNESLYLRYVWCLVEYYKDKGQFVQLNKMTLEQIELELQNILNADIGECIVDNIPEILVGLKVKQNFMYTDLLKTKYNDCWIEVIKDDKTPPVVVAPDDVTVYCDGVPYWWTLTKPYAGGTKTATVKGHGASYTHDVCEGEDALQTYCSSPEVTLVGMNTSADPVAGSVCCVEIPWDGGDFGYYGGSVCGEYSYAGGVNCDEYSYWYHDHNWQPIYCRLWLMLDQYDNPDGGHPNPQSYFDETAEDWVITDNCWAPDTQVDISGSLNECGVGTLTKTVTATDKCGNTAHDTQTLYVKPRSDFEVIFPKDVVVNCTDEANLAADRTGAGYPEISDDDCELIGVTYSDERYDVTEGCYKILRTWKLIDWCVYSPDLHSRYPDVIVDDRLVASESRCCIHRNLKDDGDGYMTYLQVIKVVDNEAPVLECAVLEDKCINDGCGEATVVYNLVSSVSDNCTLPVDMSYRYSVEDEAGAEVLRGEGQVLVAPSPAGSYQVRLIASDRCGNEDTCYTTFTIRDCKKPTPYCYHGISTVVMSPSGEVEIWATDFDAGSYDNCTNADKLIFSFTEDGTTPSWTYTCADIPDGRSQEIEVDIWVIDEAGNKDFCTTTLLLQDNTGNACQDSSPLTGSGAGLATAGQKVKGEGIRTPELYQNTPNPFSGETKIGFWLPESMQATVRVMDVTGKELYRISGFFAGGIHQVSLLPKDLPAMKGVLFYQLETVHGVLNKRMVRVE